MLQAQLLLQSGDLKAGRAALEKAYRIDPKNPRLGLIYGQFLAKIGDFPAAERELAKVVSKDPGNDDARFALASVWLELGDHLADAVGFWKAQGLAVCRNKRRNLGGVQTGGLDQFLPFLALGETGVGALEEPAGGLFGHLQAGLFLPLGLHIGHGLRKRAETTGLGFLQAKD